MSILQHTLGILLRPSAEWKEIRHEQSSFLQVFVRHVPFLALIPAVCAYIGVTQVGWTTPRGEVLQISSASAASLSGMMYAAVLAAVYLLGVLISWMSHTYGAKGNKDQRRYEGTALAVYISTPPLIAGLALLYPNLWFVSAVVGLAIAYSVYLLYEGIPILMDIPREQGFMYATSVVTGGLVILLPLLMGPLLIWAMGMGPVHIH